MGYYIEVPKSKNKAQQLIELYGAARVDESLVESVFEAPNTAVICVVDNGPFEAAGFVYNKNELRVFMRPDGRSRIWLVMERGLAETLSGYKE